MADVADLIGVPFRYGARGPDEFDCYGLVMECLRRDGQKPRDFGHADDVGTIAAMMGAALPQFEEIECRPGAIVLLRIDGLAAHCGYVIDGNRFIHTWEKSGGVVVERLDTWKRKIVGFYRYVG